MAWHILYHTRYKLVIVAKNKINNRFQIHLLQPLSHHFQSYNQIELAFSTFLGWDKPSLEHLKTRLVISVVTTTYFSTKTGTKCVFFPKLKRVFITPKRHPNFRNSIFSYISTTETTVLSFPRFIGLRKKHLKSFHYPLHPHSGKTERFTQIKSHSNIGKQN